MKNVGVTALLFPAIIAFSACQEETNQKSEGGGGSLSGKSDSQASSSLKAKGEGRKITPSSRRNVVGKSEIVSAKFCATQLTLACDGFFEEYQALPLASVSTIDATQQTDNLFMAALLGLRSAANDNPKFIPFFTFKSTTAEDKKDGLLRTKNRAELFDPWGNHYHVFLNYDYDNRMRPPISNEVFWDRQVIVWSSGPDGKSGTPETNADNVYSWTNDS